MVSLKTIYVQTIYLQATDRKMYFLFNCIRKSTESFFRFYPQLRIRQSEQGKIYSRLKIPKMKICFFFGLRRLRSCQAFSRSFLVRISENRSEYGNLPLKSLQRPSASVRVKYHFLVIT